MKLGKYTKVRRYATMPGAIVCYRVLPACPTCKGSGDRPYDGHSYKPCNACGGIGVVQGRGVSRKSIEVGCEKITIPNLKPEELPYRFGLMLARLSADIERIREVGNNTVIYGKPPAIAELDQMVMRHGIAGKVEFVRWK